MCVCNVFACAVQVFIITIVIVELSGVLGQKISCPVLFLFLQKWLRAAVALLVMHN